MHVEVCFLIDSFFKADLKFKIQFRQSALILELVKCEIFINLQWEKLVSRVTGTRCTTIYILKQTKRIQAKKGLDVEPSNRRRS